MPIRRDRKRVERSVALGDACVRMMFSSLTLQRPLRRFIASLISLTVFCVAALLFTCGFLLAERPLRYMHGGLWAAALVLLLVNALLQFPLTLTDRRLDACIAVRRRSGKAIDTVAPLVAAIGTLTLVGGAFTLALRAGQALRVTSVAADVRDYTGMCVTAALTGILLLIGAIGLCLRCFARGRYPAAEILLHLPLPLGCVTFSLYLYFDKSVPRNASLKQATSLAFLLLSLLLLLCIRELVGAPRPLLAVLLARAAVPYTGALAIGLFFLGILRKQVLVSFAVCLFLAFLSFYIYIVFLTPTAGFMQGHPRTGNGAAGADAKAHGTPDADTPKEV